MKARLVILSIAVVVLALMLAQLAQARGRWG